MECLRHFRDESSEGLAIAGCHFLDVDPDSVVVIFLRHLDEFIEEYFCRGGRDDERMGDRLGEIAWAKIGNDGEGLPVARLCKSQRFHGNLTMKMAYGIDGIRIVRELVDRELRRLPLPRCAILLKKGEHMGRGGGQLSQAWRKHEQADRNESNDRARHVSTLLAASSPGKQL